MRLNVLRVVLLLPMLLTPAVLRAGDAEPRNLLISVRQHDYPGTETRIDSNAGIHNVSGGRIATLRSPTQQPHVVTHGEAHISTATREREEQSVRALEGHPVAIRDGKLVPLALGGDWVDYAEESRGFEVTAHLDGRKVTLDVVAHGDRMVNGTLHTSSIESTVSGPLGAWIWLGDTSSEGEAHAGGIESTASTRGRDSGNEYEVKVEFAP